MLFRKIKVITNKERLIFRPNYWSYLLSFIYRSSVYRICNMRNMTTCQTSQHGVVEGKVWQCDWPWHGICVFKASSLYGELSLCGRLSCWNSAPEVAPGSLVVGLVLVMKTKGDLVSLCEIAPMTSNFWTCNLGAEHRASTHKCWCSVKDSGHKDLHVCSPASCSRLPMLLAITGWLFDCSLNISDSINMIVYYKSCPKNLITKITIFHIVCSILWYI